MNPAFYIMTAAFYNHLRITLNYGMCTLVTKNIQHFLFQHFLNSFLSSIFYSVPHVTSLLNYSHQTPITETSISYGHCINLQKKKNKKTIILHSSFTSDNLCIFDLLHRHKRASSVALTACILVLTSQTSCALNLEVLECIY